MKSIGKITSKAKNPDFGSYGVVVSFQKLIVIPESDPKEEKIYKYFELRTVAEKNGDFEFDLPDKQELQGTITFKVLAPSGEFLKEKHIDLSQLDGKKRFDIEDVDYKEPFFIEKVDAKLSPTVKGKVLDFEGKSKINKKQVLIWARDLGSEADDYRVVISTTTDDNGQFEEYVPLLTKHKGLFNERQIVPEYEDAYATVQDFDDEKIPIILESRKFPQSPQIIILVVGNEDNKKKDDCDCHSTDKNCVDFTTPNRALEEYNYLSIVRTTDPEIKGLTLEDVKPLTFNAITKFAANQIPDDNVRILSLSNTSTAAKPKYSTLNLNFAKNILAKDPDGFTPQNLMMAERLSIVNNFSSIISALLKKHPGRSVVSANNAVDWDDEPTFYQATSIAHGHILHFKQVWKADGYSLGDLLYSLPLAPRQRKQIAIVDWDRREDGARLEFSLESERVNAEISRDRDISEITNATVNEQTSGGSKASTWAAGGGLGVAIGPLVLGAAGGGGGASSSAWQNSSRSASADFLNQLRDRTVQSASAVRSQRTSVVQSVRQGETMKVTTETVGNPNHCHATTIEYFEVLRHFQVSQELSDVQECLYVPLLMSRFDRDKTIRWKDALKTQLKIRGLLKAFDASERIKNNYEGSDLPKGRYADENIEYIDGELRISFKLTRPDDNSDDSFNLNFWAPYATFLWESPLSIFNQFLSNEVKQERDKIFQRDIAPRIAEAFVQNLKFRLVTNSGSYQLNLDPTLVSTYAPNMPLYVSLRASGNVPAVERAEIVRFEIRTDTALPTYSKTIVTSGTVRYRTKHLSEFLFKDFDIRNDLTVGDPVQIPTFLNSRELRNPKQEDKELDKKLLAHLNEHIEYYHRMIWLNMDNSRRFMLLDGFIAPNSNGRSVASVVENRLIGILGNCLVMPVARGFNLDPTYKNLANRQVSLDDSIIEETSLLDLYQPITPVPPMRISVPTRGVFAESVMGKCNSCEDKETAKTWVYDDKDFDLIPTAINAVSSESRRTEPGDLTAKDFPTPIINIQNSPAAPDPIGFSGLVNMLSNPNLFKDITGLEMNQKNALAAFQSAMSASQFFGGQATQLEMQKRMLEANNMNNVMQNIQKAKKDGLITDTETNELTKSALQSMIGEAKIPKQDKLTDNPVVQDVVKSGSDSGKDVSITAPNGESVEIKSSPNDSAAQPIIIIENSSAQSRSFNPAINDKSGVITLKATIKNAPEDFKISWQNIGGEAVEFGSADKQTTIIKGLLPGLHEIGVAIYDNGGNRLASTKIQLSIPQFIRITEDAAKFDAVLTKFNVSGLKNKIIAEMKATCDFILKENNVRTIWQLGGFSEIVPPHLPAANVSIVEIKDEKVGHPSLLGDTDPSGSGNWGPLMLSEHIEIYPAAYANNISGSDIEIDVETQALVIQLESMTTSDPALDDFSVKVFGRLIGETSAHEILHSVEGLISPANAHNPTKVANDIMNNGSTRTFTNRTGLVDNAHTSPVDPANFTDNGISAINKLQAANKAKLDAMFPIPVVFK